MLGLQSSSLYRAGIRSAKVRCLAALAGALLTAVLAPAASSAAVTSTPMVDLGQASTYAVLSGASVGNTVSAPGAPFTTLRGDLGVASATQPTGFPPGVVTGATRVGSTAAPAQADLVTAYNEVANRTGGIPIPGDLAGLTLTPGLHSTAAAVSNTGTVILDAQGDPSAVFVFKVGGALTMAAGAKVTLINGAQASRVFWQVNGAAAVGAGDKFAGTVMALNAIAMGAGTVVNGRALSLNGAISLDSNDFYSAPPVVTIAGGASAATRDTTPTISGTTDVEAPAVVTVTVAGQTLTATPTDGLWSTTAAMMANGTYTVVASVTDGAGNTGTATQQLTVDTVPPVVTIDGGSSVITNDPTPTITGTSDATPGTLVTVVVGPQTLTTLVQADGSWNVTPKALSDGSLTITASVFDPAGNETTVSQALTVDTVAPRVTIDGGPTRLTDQATPDISGTAAVAAGTHVTVTLADQALTATVQDDGTWSVTAAPLCDGPHRVVISVFDAAGNMGSATQTLTVDTVAPSIAITGGAAATSTNRDPTIAGTSNAVPGTTVTVTIAGRTMTTLLQHDGTWNATPTAIALGKWPVIASVTDPAGNVGTATQTLTIAAAGTTKPFTVSLGAARSTAVRGTRMRIRVMLSRSAMVTLTVMRGTHQVAQPRATRHQAGHSWLTWNGKVKRQAAPTGTYRMVVRAVSSTGATAKDSAILHIIGPRTLPRAGI
jgi:hypothetical protein